MAVILHFERAARAARRVAHPEQTERKHRAQKSFAIYGDARGAQSRHTRLCGK